MARVPGRHRCPGILPTLVFVLLLTVIGSLLVFDYIYIMTQGGPAGADRGGRHAPL